MSEVIEQDNELPLGTASKRAAIETELRKDAGRSDREIARVVGCDHKTVGAARAKLSPLNSPAEPTPTERRHMLIEGVKDFDRRFPPGPSEVATAEEAVDNAIATGKVSAAAASDADEGEFYWPIPRQAAIECRALPDGAVEIWQEGQHGPDDASAIHIAAGNAVMLARHILYAAGFRTVGIYTRESGGNVDLENGDLAATYYHEKPGYGPVR